jgi:putative restriction endonuclease
MDCEPITGRLTEPVERALSDRGVLYAPSVRIIEAKFPPTITRYVLTAVGLDPVEVYGHPAGGSDPASIRQLASPCPQSVGSPVRLLRVRRAARHGSVGLEAAHVRSFNFDGWMRSTTERALCSLHHKLFNRGALGLTPAHHIQVLSASPPEPTLADASMTWPTSRSAPALGRALPTRVRAPDVARQPRLRGSQLAA